VAALAACLFEFIQPFPGASMISLSIDRIADDTPPLIAGLSKAVRQRLVWQARALAAFGIAWHAVEAILMLAAGISASSISLIGFGADVTVETIGGLIVLWRFSRVRALSERAEQLAQRLIGVSYFLLSGYIVFDSTQMLVLQERPDRSFRGIAIAILALIIMPQLRRAKVRVGDRLQSSALKREGMENMMCAYLSITVLLGLGLNAAFGWWWADPVAAYAVASIAARGGHRAWKGVNCCVASPNIQGVRP
jgi:divalent metal cation (Fe/Co/Zn/Cd) transporter